MGMQIHFQVADIRELSDVIVTNNVSNDKTDDNEPDNFDYWVHVRQGSIEHVFSTDVKFESAWFDIGHLSDWGKAKLFFLIRNRVCFNAS